MSSEAFFQAAMSTVQLYRKSSQQFSFMIETKSTHGVAYSEYKLDFGTPSFCSSIADDGTRRGKSESVAISNQVSYDERIAELEKSGYKLTQTVETPNMDAFISKSNNMFSQNIGNADIYFNLKFSAKEAEIPFNFDAPAPAPAPNSNGCLIL